MGSSVEAFRYLINMDGRGEDYKCLLLFDLATADIRRRLTRSGNGGTEFASDIRSAA